jgi:parallel beta-helix repeat protein
MRFKIKQLQNQILALAFVVISSVIGVYLLQSGLAASPYASVEAASGQLSGSAYVQPNSDGSGGSSVRFGGNGPTYYISPSGSDSNNGTTPQTPWQTIAKVNSVQFSAGASILFLGGSSFNGNLYFTPSESGISSDPVSIGSYGVGAATISAGTGVAIKIYDDSDYSISNLNLVGSGAATNTSAGLNFYDDLNSTTALSNIFVQNVNVSGFQYGFLMGGTGNDNYNNVNVINSIFHDNELAGLDTYGPNFDASNPAYQTHNITIAQVTAYNNLGSANLTGTVDSGNGIVLGSVQDANIEQSTAYNNGTDCTASNCGVGIWAYDSTDVTIEHNESYDNHTASSADGDGFDLDQNTSDSIMQYNYSQNNDGAGYLLYGLSDDSDHTNNIVRYNISQNDGRKNSYGAITLYGNVIADDIYNNTVYLSSSSSGGTPEALEIYGLGSGKTFVSNNIFYVSSGLLSVYVVGVPSDATLIFLQNDYYNFNVNWDNIKYTSFADWQKATSQEKLSGKSYGLTVNPELNNPGGGTINEAANLSQLTQYQLASDSPMKGIGINLNTQFSLLIGQTDFYGVALPLGESVSVGAAQ